MINLDAYLINFVTNNYMTVGLILTLLKILATETKITADDKVINFLLNLVKPSTYKKGKK